MNQWQKEEEDEEEKKTVDKMFYQINSSQRIQP